MLSMQTFLFLFAYLSLSSLAHPFLKRGISNGPVIASNFADPAFIQLNDTYYAFSTNNGKHNIPIATSTDFNAWTLTDVDAFPSENFPAWVNGTIWAPDVIQLPNGAFVLYYSAATNNDTSKHCVGAATSSDIHSPFSAPKDEEPFACPLKDGGAIDSAAFLDPSTSLLYVAYKTDGNSLGGGGPCGNGDGSHPTPIMLQQVSPQDGTTRLGAPLQILDRDASDGPLVEAPSLARSAEGTYILFYSSHCFNGEEYDVKYATAETVEGPYVKGGAPLLKSGDAGGALKSPGGADLAADAGRVVFHADREAGEAGVREMYVGEVRVEGRMVMIL
ncbi:MAG: hypothetical protein Q9219_005620 [cf. Caloplaca sp. 3 TL-2023]